MNPVEWATLQLRSDSVINSAVSAKCTMWPKSRRRLAQRGPCTGLRFSPSFRDTPALSARERNVMAGFHIGSRFPRSIRNDVGEDESLTLHRFADRERDRRRKYRPGGDCSVKLAIFAANRDRFGPIGRSDSVRRRLTSAGCMDAARNDCVSGSVFKCVRRSARSDFRSCQPPKDIER